MPNLKRNFIKGRMNKSLDERLVPNGEYVDAMNVRLGSTESSEIGSVENTKGNTALTVVEVNGQQLSKFAKCIGAFEDGARETIYWFVHDPQFAASSSSKCDLILSYNITLSLITYHIISINNDASFTDTRLNFNPKYLITGVDMVDDLLFFTDDYNPPRRINIKQSYPVPSPAGAAGIDQFLADDILVIKGPPTDAPIITLSNNGSTNNYLKDKFICFAYRYKYENGEYSATSPFSPIAFTSKPFGIDATTYLNEGMTNKYNLAKIQIYTGDSLVKGFDLLFKEAASTTIRVIEKIDKVKQGVPDQSFWSLDFDNSKIYTILPSYEILRLYDNVPRFAKAQSVMGNRLMYGNYIDGYNLLDSNNNSVRFDYYTSLISNEIDFNILPAGQLTKGNGVSYQINPASSPTITDCQALIDFTGMPLTAGTTFNLTLTFIHSQFEGTPPTPTTPLTTITLTYTLPQDFNSVFDMAQSASFENAIGTITNIQIVPNSCTGATLTDFQNCNVPATLGSYTKTASGIVNAGEPIAIDTSAASNVVGLQLVAMVYVGTAVIAYEYYKITSLSLTYSSLSNAESLHSDRGYDIGIVYLDKYCRATTALTSISNTVFVPCANSILKNEIQVTIPTTQLPPSWAAHYKFVCKSDRETYFNVFSNFFYPDNTGGYYWYLLEGDNAAKVEKGDKLKVKRDSEGAVLACVSTMVLEKEVQPRGFIDNTVTPELPPQAGVYIKLLPKGFASNYDENATKIIFNGGKTCELTSGDFPTANGTCNDFDGANYIDYTIPSGSTISIDIRFLRKGYDVLGVTCENIEYEFIRTFTAISDYANFQLFWEAQVEPQLNTGNQISSGTTITQAQLAAVTSASPPSQPTFSSFENTYRFWRQTGGGDGRLYLQVSAGVKACPAAASQDKRKVCITTNITVQRATQLAVFETMPIEPDLDIFYEGSQTFDIKSGKHFSGNAPGDQNQTALLPAIVNLNFSNCISFGNGVESYQIEDSVSGQSFNLGNRTTAVSAQDYKEADRFADITYSGVYNDESNVNKLNEFNLGLANFLPLEDSFGSIEILHARATDLLVLQEDRISYVTVGKNILTDAVGGGTVTSVPQVLGQQVARQDQYGISNNPESFVVFGYDKFFTDSKRGAVLRLRGSAGQSEQLTVLSEVGMRSWFRNLFIDYGDTQKLGGFDPYMNEYVLSSNTTKKPVIEECIECGITQNITVPMTTEYSFCAEFGTVTGTVDIPYALAVGDSATIAVTYNGVTTSTGIVSGSGTLSFSKSLPSVTTASIVITATGSDATLRFTVECPQTSILTVVQVCVTSDIDNAQMIHNEFGYTDGTYISPTNSTAVTFVAGTTNPLISQYDTFSGVQGDSFSPTNGSTVKLTSQRLGFDNFTFDTANDKFRYLRTNTVYSNNPVDIAALIAASTQALPLVVTGAPNTYYAEFTMPAGTDEKLYVIYDYRNSVEHGLCYDAASITDVCCVCTFNWYLMRNSADATEEYVAISPTTVVIGAYYTLINHGSKCFEVISTSTTVPTETINTTCTP
tara:strand:- start:21735 stop:26333 length:4599 start_codon:yes stop_codon:yes gene_type:complete